MNYVKTFISISFCFFIGFINGKSQNYTLDSVYYVKIDPFLSRIIALEDLEANIMLSREEYIIPTNGTLFSPNAQEIIKNKKILYVTIQQTGFLFEYMGLKDSLAIFKRMDATVNINYNIGCLTFIYKDQLFSYGGYGFWKSNGHIRKYNYLDRQWDIIPTNKEIFNIGYNWFSKKEGKLYVPFQRITNAGLIGGTPYLIGFNNYQSYIFDMRTLQWEKIGALSKQLIELINKTGTGATMYTFEQGQLLLLNDESWFFNYHENKVYHNVKAEFNQFLIRRAGLFDTYLYKGNIYSYSTGYKDFTIMPFNLSNFELMNYPIWGRDNSYDIYIAGSIGFMIIIIAIIWFFTTRVKRKFEQAQLKLLKTKSVNQAFIGTEVALITLLTNAAEENKKVDIFQINHVLGIKDKNIGLQKKVRSDIINMINEKYQFITQADAQLISSIRKEDDKRFFEYFIANDEIKTIKRLIEKN
jgi:hypothetical protein